MSYDIKVGDRLLASLDNDGQLLTYDSEFTVADIARAFWDQHKFLSYAESGTGLVDIGLLEPILKYCNGYRPNPESDHFWSTVIKAGPAAHAVSLENVARLADEKGQLLVEQNCLLKEQVQILKDTIQALRFLMDVTKGDSRGP